MTSNDRATIVPYESKSTISMITAGLYPAGTSHVGALIMKTKAYRAIGDALSIIKQTKASKCFFLLVKSQYTSDFAIMNGLTATCPWIWQKQNLFQKTVIDKKHVCWPIVWPRPSAPRRHISRVVSDKKCRLSSYLSHLDHA